MKIQRLLATTILSALLASGCQAPPDANSSALNERVAVLEQKVTDLEAKGESSSEADIEALQKRLETLEQSTVKTVGISEAPEMPKTPEATEAPSQEPTPTEEETPSEQSERMIDTVDFSSFPSPQRLKELVSFDFLPKAEIYSTADLEGEITRGQYIAMLVEMNNFMFDSDSGKSIRLARGGDQTFTDVPGDHPYYKYIQGMVDAGYVIGFDEVTFKPEKVLTREEMLAIAAKRDYELKPDRADYFWRSYSDWTDKDEIAPKYRYPISYDASKNGKANSKQAFGDAKLLKPKQSVRAYEAVLSLYQLGNHGNYQYNKRVKETLGDK